MYAKRNSGMQWQRSYHGWWVTNSDIFNLQDKTLVSISPTIIWAGCSDWSDSVPWPSCTMAHSFTYTSGNKLESGVG